MIELIGTVAWLKRTSTIRGALLIHFQLTFGQGAQIVSTVQGLTGYVPGWHRRQSLHESVAIWWNWSGFTQPHLLSTVELHVWIRPIVGWQWWLLQIVHSSSEVQSEENVPSYKSESYNFLLLNHLIDKSGLTTIVCNSLQPS